MFISRSNKELETSQNSYSTKLRSSIVLKIKAMGFPKLEFTSTSVLLNKLAVNFYKNFPQSGSTLIYTILIHQGEKAMAPHSSTLAWKIPWTEEPGGLQSTRSLRVRHD